MPLPITITTAGRAALINADNTGTGPTEIAHVGLSANPLVPTAADTVLPGELKRVPTISGDVVAADTIHVAMFDDSADAYALRSFALYLADGTLFALFGLAPAVADPVLNKTSQSIAALIFDVILADINAASISFGDTTFSNPPATTDRRGVIQLATTTIGQAGDDTTRAITARVARDSVLSWLGYTPANRAGDIFTGSVAVAGDIYAYRPGASGAQGVLYLNQTATRFLINDGVNYQLVGQPLFVNGGLAWTSANDGAGSGMDADLLDGQQGAYYTDIAARLGYTPANRAGDIFTGSVAVAGDIYAYRPGASGAQGVLYLNQTATRFLINDGVNYQLVGQPLFVNGGLAWTSANDGAGSGMDADLLDGQQGAYYTDIAARLGFVPLNAALYTAADVLAKLAGVDGSGSGLDADLLDGQQGAYYTDIAARLGFVPLNAALYTAADVLAKLAGVDGSGSGLDADLLDGKQAADFVLKGDPTTSGSNANGHWSKDGNGYITQWGWVPGNRGEGSYTHTFPVPFTDLSTISFTVNLLNPAGDTGQGWDTSPQLRSFTVNDMTFLVQASSVGAICGGYSWEAKGK